MSIINADQIWYRFVLVLGRSIPTFELKCITRSNAHRSLETIQQILNNRIGLQHQQLLDWT
jgi:hypothetical protein